MAQTLTNNTNLQSRTIKNSRDHVEANVDQDVLANKKTNSIDISSIFSIQKIGELNDVDTANRKHGSVLVYDSERGVFAATTKLESQTINGGNY
tara:strand:+ start:624 stop:905 length:282 start_codon:yes stop_codon:yes gene_type:complete